MATEVQTTTLETIKASSLTEATSISDSNYVVITDNSVSKKAKATLFKGLKGDTGASGREIEIAKDSTYIKWRYVGETSWNNLVALSELKGDKGDPGAGVDLSSYATQAWVTEQIANIQGGGSVDLSSYYTKTEIDNKGFITDISGKVDKVDGKGLSTNDYTTEEKNKLAGLSNYDDTEIKASIPTKTSQLIN